MEVKCVSSALHYSLTLGKIKTLSMQQIIYLLNCDLDAKSLTCIDEYIKS